MPATKTSDETAAATLTGAELIRAVQSAANVKLTVNQILAFIAAAKTFTDPTILGALTLGGGDPAALDFPNAGDTEITASGGGGINLATWLRLNGGLKDSAGSLGSAYDALISNGADILWRGRQAIPFVYNTTAATWTMGTADSFIFGANGYRSQTKLDLTNYTQARIAVTIGSGAPVADTLVYLRYCTTQSVTLTDFLPMGAAGADVQVALPNAGNLCTAGDWVDLVAGAKADVYVVVAGIAPSGSTAVSVQTVVIEFR